MKLKSFLNNFDHDLSLLETMESSEFRNLAIQIYKVP